MTDTDSLEVPLLSGIRWTHPIRCKKKSSNEFLIDSNDEQLVATRVPRSIFDACVRGVTTPHTNGIRGIFSTDDGCCYVVSKVHSENVGPLSHRKEELLEESELLSIFSQLATELATYHSYGLAHGNVTIDNVFVNQDHHYPPFSSLEPRSAEVHHFTCALGLPSPQPGSPEDDIFALGVLYLQMCSREVRSTDVERLTKVAKTTRGKEEILKCLAADPTTRPTALSLCATAFTHLRAALVINDIIRVTLCGLFFALIRQSPTDAEYWPSYLYLAVLLAPKFDVPRGLFWWLVSHLPKPAQTFFCRLCLSVASQERPMTLMCLVSFALHCFGVAPDVTYDITKGGAARALTNSLASPSPAAFPLHEERLCDVLRVSLLTIANVAKGGASTPATWCPLVSLIMYTGVVAWMPRLRSTSVWPYIVRVALLVIYCASFASDWKLMLSSAAMMLFSQKFFFPKRPGVQSAMYVVATLLATSKLQKEIACTAQAIVASAAAETIADLLDANKVNMNKWEVLRHTARIVCIFLIVFTPDLMSLIFEAIKAHSKK